MFKKPIIYNSLILIVFSLLINTSLIYSQPQIKITLRGGYNSPTGDLKGDAAEPLDKFDSYLMKSGYNFGGDVKYFISKKRNIGITLGGAYNTFSSGEFDTVGTVKLDTGVGILKLNALQVGLGVEYDFMPRDNTNPYLGIEFTGHFFSGNSSFTPTNESEVKYEMKTANRFGIAVGAGVEMKFTKMFGAMVGFKYHAANLIGKAADTSLSGNEYALNDKEHININGAITGNRNINYIQLNAGFSLLLNEPKRTIRK